MAYFNLRHYWFLILLGNKHTDAIDSLHLPYYAWQSLLTFYSQAGIRAEPQVSIHCSLLETMSTISTQRRSTISAR